MSLPKIRKLLVLPLIIAIAIGVLYFNFTGSSTASLPAAGPAMMGMEDEGARQITIEEATGPDVTGPFIGEAPVAASFDGDVRDLPQVPPAVVGDRIEMPSPRQGNASDNLDVVDPVAQTDFGGTLAMPAPGANFLGLDQASWGAGWPPDTNGDVGPSHYIQTVNTSIGIYNKTGTRLAAYTFDTFFSGTGTSCDDNNNGDPVVLYDAISGRWIITDFAWTDTANGPYYECIAVSKTTDPVSGGWWMYGFRADDASHAWLNDYPKLGVWRDGIYMSVNMFDCLDSSCSSATYKGVRVWALNRDAMINGQALTNVYFDTSSSYFSIFPTNFRGAQPPAGTPNFFLSLGSSTTLQMWKFNTNWTTPANSTFTGPTNITVASYTEPSVSVPQSGTTIKLDTLGDRLMVQLQYRYLNGVQSLWLSHTVASGGVTGVRWYEIRNPQSTPSVYQQSTYQPDSTYRWMPSIAVDGSGNAAIGYSASSSSIFPGIRYAGRLVTDPINALSQGEGTLVSGGGYQSSYTRWGDYSALTVDPVDDCTFWYTTEYYTSSGTNWQTRIGSFKFPSCGGGPTPTATNTSLPPTATFTPQPATATPTPGGCPNEAGGYCRTDYEARTWIAGSTNLNITGDDQTVSVSLPFNFTFAGTSYSTIVVSSNGNAHFGTASSAYSNATIPTSSVPNAMIAPFWDDMNPSAGGVVYSGVSGTAPNRTFVIEWRDVRCYAGGTSGGTFEIQLVESTNNVWILYQDTAFGTTSCDSGISATSGIENAAGTAGNLYSYNASNLTSGKNLHFWPSAVSPTNTPVPPTATFTPLPPTATNTPGTCPNQSGGYCRTDNETRSWIAGTTNQAITGDDTTKTVTLPFSFTFMGTAYTSVKISSNGNIHFGTASSAYTNVSIPNTAAPNAMVAAFWDDLSPNLGGAIYTTVSGTAPNRVFVIEWRDVRRYGYGTTGATFEIQLVETSNQIWILYQDTYFGSSTVDYGKSATAGIENAGGTAGNLYSYNSAILTANKVLHFWPQ